MDTLYRYTGTGSTTYFTYPTYDSELSEIVVHVDEVEVSYTFDGAYVVVSPAPASGTAVVVFRKTQNTSRLVDYQNGSLLSESDLDKDSNQLFALIQEKESETDYKVDLSTEESKLYIDTEIDTTNTNLTNYIDGEITDLSEQLTMDTQLYTDDSVSGMAGTLTTNYTIADAATLQSANDYTDNMVIDGGGITQTYVDTGDSDTLSSANEYTDNGIGIVTSSYQLADSGVLLDSNNYTDEQLLGYMPSGEINTLISNYVLTTELTTKLNDFEVDSNNKIINEAIRTDYFVDTASNILVSGLNLRDYNNAHVTMDASFTIANDSINTVGRHGQSGIISFTQDATGGYIVNFGTNWKFEGGTAPTTTTTAGSSDIVVYYIKDDTTIIANYIVDVKSGI